MASRVSRDLVGGAMGESGSILTNSMALKDAEASGSKFAESLGLHSLKELRELPAQKLLDAVGKPGAPRFGICVDGYFFPEAPKAIYAAGKQAHIPLLAGWNSEEQGTRAVLGREQPSLANYRAAVERLYKDHAPEVLKVYAWEPDDFKVSKTMQDYFANFIKSGDPNGSGLPEWPTVKGGKPAQVMHININPRTELEQPRDRYEVLDAIAR